MAIDGNNWVAVRPSMVKFETSNPEKIGIVDYAKPGRPGYLNEQIIRLLLARGVSIPITFTGLLGGGNGGGNAGGW